MKTILLTCILLTHVPLITTAHTVGAQSPERRVHGASVELRDEEGRRLGRGELLAFARDTLWLLPSADELPVPYTAGTFDEVRVRAFGSAHTLTWSLIGWGVTSIGLAAACGNYGEGGCGGVPAAMAIPWGLIGGLAVGLRESRRWRVMHQPSFRELAPYARFPQGLPGTN